MTVARWARCSSARRDTPSSFQCAWRCCNARPLTPRTHPFDVSHLRCRRRPPSDRVPTGILTLLPYSSKPAGGCRGCLPGFFPQGDPVCPRAWRRRPGRCLPPPRSAQYPARPIPPSRPEPTRSTAATYDVAAGRRLTECRPEFLRFFRSRLSRPEDAEDAFQDFCLKVIRAAQAPGDGGKVDAWLRRVLRNTLTDYYRRRATRQRAEAAYEVEAPEPVIQPGADQQDNQCRCVRDLVPTLRPDYAEIIHSADPEQEPRA